jgi:hypothetical protein
MGAAAGTRVGTAVDAETGWTEAGTICDGAAARGGVGILSWRAELGRGAEGAVRAADVPPAVACWLAGRVGAVVLATAADTEAADATVLLPPVAGDNAVEADSVATLVAAVVVVVPPTVPVVVGPTDAVGRPRLASADRVSRYPAR